MPLDKLNFSQLSIRNNANKSKRRTNNKFVTVKFIFIPIVHESKLAKELYCLKELISNRNRIKTEKRKGWKKITTSAVFKILCKEMGLSRDLKPHNIRTDLI